MGKLVKNITSIDKDFSKWYTDVVIKAELIDYSAVRGCNILRPYGYAIWENIVNILDKKFKNSEIENVSMPIFIPESLLQKEKDHVKGFAPEVAWVTLGGGEELSEKLCVRPTSEVLFCSHFQKIINSWRDLPKLYNQWCSVVRWEKTSRPFLRSVEIHWQEGHTVHETSEEAKNFTLKMLNLYKDFFENILCIPVILGQKTESEKFAGAEFTYTVECMMKDGKALQSATSHYFGNSFAKAFDIKFTDKNNKELFVYQTSWGLSTRVIASVIMTHGDDDGLVLPPDIAPIQVIIIPINLKNKLVLEKAREICDVIKNKLKLRCKIDQSEQTPGWKFANYEMKGVPIRIEIGPRDIENNQCILVRRDNHEKITCRFENLSEIIEKLILNIKQNMYKTALINRDNKIKNFESEKDFENFQGFIKVPFCENLECENNIKQKYAFTTRCIPFETSSVSPELPDSTCPICGKKAKNYVYFAKAY